MAKQPNAKVIQKILKIKEEIKAIYEKSDEQNAKLVKKYGAGEWVIENPQGEGYLKLTITDNLIKLQNGEKIWKSANFTRHSIEVKILKNKPKVKVEDNKKVN